MTKVLVTGGSGLLGRFVVDQLRARSVAVTVLDLGPPLQAGIPFVEADIRDAGAVRAAMAGHDRVIHLAGYDDGDAPDEGDYMTTNLVGAWNVLSAAEAEGVTRFVGASSNAATGIGRGCPPEYLPVDEDHPLKPTDGYAVAKEAMEGLGRAFVRRSGMAVAMLRPTLIVRPEMAPRMIAELNAVGEDQGIAVGAPLYGGLPAFRAWVSSRDCAAAFVDAVMSNGWAGHVDAYVAADDAMAGADTIATVEAVVGHRPEIRDPRRYEIDPAASALSNIRAKCLFGWTPRDRWRDIVALVRDRPWTFDGWRG